MKSFHITVIEGTGDPVRQSVSGQRSRCGIFLARFAGCADREAHLRGPPPSSYQEQADSPHNPTVVPTLQASRFFEQRIPRPYAGGRHISTRGQTTTRLKGCQALEHFSMTLFNDSAQRMEELINNSKKVRRGATLERAEMDGSWLTIYPTISRRYRDDKDLGVSRYPYELHLN
jgi:hypothetical protein